MTDDFNPPIQSRTTKELLEIVGAPKKWNPKAVSLANTELLKRGVKEDKIKTAKYLNEKRERIIRTTKAKEGYSILHFIFLPIQTLVELLFSWELKKDGFDRKAKQQKYFRLSLLALIVVFFLYHIIISTLKY
ncbi:hypothetical protein [uncultured Tenacibaculum sp.]|uniref:hypothetical protein n=1 Tax=uncultured Tenacibaculum sp. TaxID=174713 RepID=UPI00262F7052|nr:hypothetical protein [uncultured Tenacibaculum sp.]